MDRNRVKRQIRESMRHIGPHLGSYDYNVVIPKTKKMDYLFAQRLRASIFEQLPTRLPHHPVHH